MAALNFDDYGGQPEGGSLTTALNWLGAFLSILLIAGLATWGWKLWVRDVSGVPVVRALEGPMRVAPDEPGGVASNYQGLTVNRIAEERVSETATEQVVLAPQPTTLDEGEDLAMAELPPIPVEETPPTTLRVIETEALTIETDQIVASVTEQAKGQGTASPQIGAPAILEETVTGTVEVIEPVEPALSATDLAVAEALGDLGLKPEPAVQKIAAAAGVPTITPRPLVRPANLQLVSAQAPQRNDTTGEIDASTIAPGTRLVQLGAYGSADVARAEWTNAMAQFGDYMVGKEPVIQEAKAGGRNFYRLRTAGFTNLADARRFCAVFVADGANCIPVLQE